jgi:hypothetical protein
LANGHYFSLSGIGAPIWASLLSGNTPDAILASVAGKRPDLMDDAVGFLARLVELDLVRPYANGHGDAALAVHEDWSGEGPRIEMFDDLAELIFADPIHDVDEQVGWPAPRPAQ